MIDKLLLADCWVVPLPTFQSKLHPECNMQPTLVRCVLMSIAHHHGEFTPTEVVARRIGCHKQVARRVIATLIEFGLVDDLGPDFDMPRGQRRGGYHSRVRRLAINREKLAALLNTPRVHVEGKRWRSSTKRKAVLT